MKRRTKVLYKSNTKTLVINHIKTNAKLYFIILMIFVIGICIGVSIINQLPDMQVEAINQYINNSINAIKNNNKISQIHMLQQSILKNIFVVLIIWILGLTFIGNFLLYFVALTIGISFGYTISAIMTTLSFPQGVLFFLTSMFLQNLINIPAIMFLVVQGLKCREDFVSNQNTNAKFIAIRYTIYSIITILVLIFASLIEVYVSGELIYWIIKYI